MTKWDFRLRKSEILTNPKLEIQDGVPFSVYFCLAFLEQIFFFSSGLPGGACFHLLRCDVTSSSEIRLPNILLNIL